MAILGFQITEKSTAQAGENKYTFWVEKNASKTKIKEAIEDRFKVIVDKINTINLRGKEKKWRQQKGKRSDRKKAIVTLKKGQRIKEFELNE